jgi:undecaprenyl diphosphate synthase
LDALPKRVRDKAKEAMEKTKDNRGPMLNVCMAYTGREDIARAVMKTREDVRGGALDASEVDERAVASRLHGAEREIELGAGMPEVDLLVRTSGETRLSDFTLFNARFAKLVFVEVLWPDFTFMDLVHAVWQYQLGAKDLKRSRQAYDDANAIEADSAVVAEVRVQPGRVAKGAKRSV